MNVIQLSAHRPLPVEPLAERVVAGIGRIFATPSIGWRTIPVGGCDILIYPAGDLRLEGQGWTIDADDRRIAVTGDRRAAGRWMTVLLKGEIECAN